MTLCSMSMFVDPLRSSGAWRLIFQFIPFAILGFFTCLVKISGSLFTVGQPPPQA